MPNPGDVITITGCPCCGGSSSISSSSGSGTNCLGCCCSLIVGGVEVACGNCIIAKTSLNVTDPCYPACSVSPKIVASLTIVHAGSSEVLTPDATDCTKWYNHGSLAPFQTSAILHNNQFTMFYVKSTSPLCIYTATGVPCVNGQTFTWAVSPPGTGCTATLAGSISW